MDALIQQIEELSAFVMSADPTDLTGLADAHSRMEEVARMANLAGVSAAVRDVGRCADAAKRTLERLILNDVTDAQQEIACLTETVTEMQRMVRVAVNGAEVLDPTRLRPDASTFTAASPLSSQPQDIVAPSQPPDPGYMVFDPIDEPTAKNSSVESAVKMPVAFLTPVSTPSAPPYPDALTVERHLSADDLPLLREFVGEANSHLEMAEAELLALEDEPGNVDAIGSVFRAFHTIKGVAGFLNLDQIQALSHAAENLLDKSRQGQLPLTGPASELVLEALDLLKVLVNNVDTALKTGAPLARQHNVQQVATRVNAFVESGGTPHSESPEVASNDRDAHKNGSADVGKSDGATCEAPRLAGEHAAVGASDTTIKVSTDRLDNLINMVGELVIAQSMLGSDIGGMTRSNARLARNSMQVGKITRELQELSMSLRMIPLSGVFAKMKRLVRDVARKAGKEIEFVVNGGDTELDRNMVAALSDPLVHMVRNSIDHGIEPPTDREKAGKARTGRLELRAYHQAGNINIEVIDDGKGLNKQRILQKAIASGLVSAGENLTDLDTFKLIFAPGLSTAEKVTDISGRGVGMDVVKKNIEGLRGRIEIQSVEGGGSTFTIRLPLTLAVIDGLIVKVGAQKYVLPITSIEKSIRPKREHLSTVQGRGELCLVRGDLLPILRLHQLFDVVPATEDPTEALIVVVTDNDHRVCLLVDELLGQEQVVIKSLGDALQKPPGVSGGAVLGDGNVSLILDVPGLIELAAMVR